MAGNVTIRLATEADGPVLADLERRSPLQSGAGSVSIDRGDDYWAAARLMEDVVAIIAEVDGVPAGVFCGAVHRAVVGGVERRMLYFHHTRILPEFQRQGLGMKLAPAVREALKDRKSDSDYWYISPRNEKSQSFAKAAPNRWSVQPLYVTLSCEALLGPPFGRPATPADAAKVVEILNWCHGDEEMFLPYTVESLVARLSRAPAQYSWERVWMTDLAAVGVWPSGDCICVRYTEDGVTTEGREGAVLDYGFLPGGEDDLVALLRAWCGWLDGRGMEEMTLFSCAGTKSWPVVSGLATAVSAFDFWTPSIPEPEGAAEHGLYVDHVYF